MLKRRILSLLGSVFLIGMGFGFPNGLQADQEFEPLEKKTLEERSLESKTFTPEPEFLGTRTPSRYQGAYFGVGFRQVQFELLETTLGSVDATANGIASNLGLLWENWLLEYARQVSILDIKEGLIYEEELRHRVEFIQNNFWALATPRLFRNVIFNGGVGLQFSQIRLLQEGNTIVEETSGLLGVGISYFVTDHLLLNYRFNYGLAIPSLNRTSAESILTSSQIHTLFIDYYFAL